MAQITDTLIAEYERAHADGKHAPMTIGEEQQLIHAWKQQHQPQHSPARVEGELTDEQIREIVRVAVSEGRLSWLGYDLDENERYTIPSLSPYHYQLARAIERALNQRLAVKEGEVVVRRLIECRSSVAFDLRNYEQLILRKGESVNQCDHDEANRLQSLLDFIDELIDAPQPTHPVSDDQQAKDAARYQWLRKTTTSVGNGKGGSIPVSSPEELDAAIDAALSTTKQEG